MQRKLILPINHRPRERWEKQDKRGPKYALPVDVSDCQTVSRLRTPLGNIKTITFVKCPRFYHLWRLSGYNLVFASCQETYNFDFPLMPCILICFIWPIMKGIWPCSSWDSFKELKSFPLFNPESIRYNAHNAVDILEKYKFVTILFI